MQLTDAVKTDAESTSTPRSGDNIDDCHQYVKMYFNYLSHNYQYNEKVSKRKIRGVTQFQEFRYANLNTIQLLEKLRNDCKDGSADDNDEQLLADEIDRSVPYWWKCWLIFGPKDQPTGLEFNFLLDNKNKTKRKGSTRAEVRENKKKNSNESGTMSGEGRIITTISESIANEAAAKTKNLSAQTKNLSLSALQGWYETKKNEFFTFFEKNNPELESRITTFRLTEEEIAEARTEMKNAYIKLKGEVEELEMKINKLLTTENEIENEIENENENTNEENA